MMTNDRPPHPGRHKKFGSYEILEPIGVGGMGEVYRARDTKLGRDVAIKVLPEIFSEDEERLLRFEREARVLASLNHPNIASIYGLEDSDGVQFIVLELVDGETLAEQIARGPIPVEDALPLFKQIAEALEAAHEKGIIHRDLKPANIKVTPDGKVKVLDFGLAKAFGEEPAENDMSESPTATFGATRAGVIMGTAPYMSPEQARGKALDKRTDIWSFGCCLFEALTGRKAFQGETVTDTIAAVVKTEPDWEALPSGLPWRVRELAKRCLRKDRSRRFNDAGAARLEIEDALTEPSVEPAVVTPSSPGHRVIPSIVTAMTGALVAGVILWGLMQPSPPPIRHLSVNLPANDDLPPTTLHVSALSPDGKHLVYVARRDGKEQLYVRSLDRLEAKSLRGSEGARAPFFSPDSQWVGFVAGTKLKKIPLAGGPAVVLCDSPILFGADWAADDTIFYSPDAASELWRVSASGGTPERVTVLKKDERGHTWPHALPGGKAVLFTVQAENPADMSVAVVSLETGERWILLRGTHPRFIPTGHIVFAQSGSLMAVPFDSKRLEIAGAPIPILDGVQITLSGAARFSISRDGSLLYVPGDRGTGVGNKLVRVDRQGVEEPLIEESRFFIPHPRFDAEGRRLALSIAVPGQWDIWILEVARGTLTRLTFDDFSLRPIWSPDGRRVIFGSNRVDDTYSIFSKAADGSGEAEQLTQGAYRIPTSLSSDGKVLIFRQGDSNSNWDTGMLRLDGESEPEIILGTPFHEHTGMLSPDDRWLAYVSNESGREEVYVCSFPVSGGKVQVSAEGGTEPMWSRDGRELFYRNGEKMMGVTVSAAPDFTPSKPTLLFEGHYETGLFGGTPGVNYDVSPDGRFLMVKAEEGSGPRQLNIILNWTQELERIAPK